MATAASDLPVPGRRLDAQRRPFWAIEDWWSIVIGLGLVAAAVIAYRAGSSLSWLAVAPPAKWHEAAALSAHFASAWPRYLGLYALWAVSFGVALRALGLSARAYVVGFTALFALSIAIYTLGQWESAARYNLEPPLVALALGLLISNTIGTPAWLKPALRVEIYIKTGIVLLGAGVPLALILWAGPVVIGQAGIVSLVTFGVIYTVATRLGLDRRLAATLGTGGAVCGVSGAIAVAGAVGARREDAPIAITLVIFWAVVMIFALPFAARSLGLPTGIAGAWIGTSEFADAAGLAAAQTYGGFAGQPGIAGSADAAVNAFTLMKVIGRDVWIGVWAFVLSFIAATRWESTGVAGRVPAGEIWARFPKFVLGFLVASLLISAVASGLPYAEYKRSIVPTLVQPLQGLRTWAFLFGFLSIGLSTRYRDLWQAGGRPFYAFTAGVIVNVLLGYVLSVHVFADFWGRFGQ